MCPKQATKDDDDSSISSKSSSKASSSDKKSIKQLQKKVNKQFAQLKTQIEEDKDLSIDEEQSHLQFMAVSKLAKAHEEISLTQFKGKLRDLNLRMVVLLGNQYTTSLFCNKWLIKNIQKPRNLWR